MGDIARDSKKHDEAIGYYSNALSLDPTHLNDILLKRSKVQAIMGWWEEALVDACKVYIVFHVTSDGPQSSILSRSSSSTHHHMEGMRGSMLHYTAWGVIATRLRQLSSLEQSSDPQIRSKLFCQYFNKQTSDCSGQSFVLTMSTQLSQFEM